MDRDTAWALVCEYTESPALRRHMQAVETCMRAYANKLGQDAELWGATGLLHDFDYEKHPDEHPLVGMKLLSEKGAPEPLVRAIASHYEAKTGVAPESLLERHLFACDELAGFVVAVTYVRPSKSVLDVEVKSVTKKLKEPSFAAGVNRDDVYKGCELIGLSLNEHIENVLAAMKADASTLGLA